MKEIWKDVVGYEGLYKVSNLGNVFSIPRQGTHSKEKYFLKKNKDRKGYLHVTLFKKCKSFNTGVHRLVAEAFIPNPKNKPQVNHIDGNKENNCVNNLEWVTNEENMQHSLSGDFIKTWYCIKDIERELGFDNRNICACCRHKKNIAYGYIWRYYGDSSDLFYNPKTKNKYSKNYLHNL